MQSKGYVTVGCSYQQFSANLYGTIRERYKTENPEFATAGHVDFDAVLDGQQRLTGLYIGLCGTYAYFKGRVGRQNNEYALPTRRLRALIHTMLLKGIKGAGSADAV